MAPPPDNLDGDNPCHAHACALQACMQKTWNQDKCEDHIKELYRCCARLYVKKGSDTEVDACPIVPVVRRKLKAFGEESKLDGLKY